MFFEFEQKEWIPQIGDAVLIPVEYVPEYDGDIYIIGDKIRRAAGLVVDEGDGTSVGIIVSGYFQKVFFFDKSLFKQIVRGYPG